MILKIKKLHEDAKIPHYATSGAACFDLSAIESSNVESCDNATFSTGLAFEVPEGYVLLIYSRSGHGFKNDIRLANCTGVIDSDYRGEVKVKLTNDGAIGYKINAGDRIAQAMLIPVPKVELMAVTELSDTERGTGGFGSTGNE